MGHVLGIQHLTLPEQAARSNHVAVHTPIRTTRGLLDGGVLSGASVW
jgi:hypothetical protein